MLYGTTVTKKTALLCRAGQFIYLMTDGSVPTALLLVHRLWMRSSRILERSTWISHVARITNAGGSALVTARG